MVELIFTLVILGALGFMFLLDGNKNKIPFISKVNKKNNKNPGKQTSNTSNKDNNKTVKQTQDNLPFDKIESIGGPEDKSLIVKGDNTYIGVIEIKGVNYNLLSIEEKFLLEEVFQRILNGLDYPIQIYIQSRKVNVDGYNRMYKERIDELIESLKNEEHKYRLMKEKYGETNEVIAILDRVRMLNNQIQYGNQVIEFINSIANNSDILDKKYFIITQYYYDESKFNLEQTEEEKFLTAFNTINNRLESILGGFKGANMEGHMLNGLELVDLLYTSFNKYDADKYKIDNAIKSGFANHIITSRAVEYKILEHEKEKMEELLKQEQVRTKIEECGGAAN